MSYVLVPRPAKLPAITNEEEVPAAVQPRPVCEDIPPAATFDDHLYTKRYLEGKVLRRHFVPPPGDGEGDPPKTWEDVGRIVYVTDKADDLWVIDFPKVRKSKPSAKKKCRGKVFKLNNPRYMTRDELRESIRARTLSVVPFVAPESWSITDQELESGVHLEDAIDGRNRDLGKWNAKREKRKALVKPLFDAYTVRDLLEFGAYKAAITEYAPSPKARPNLKQAVLLQMLGCGHPMALLPAWENTGRFGKERLDVKPGVWQRDKRKGLTDDNGFKCNADARYNLQVGYATFKRNRFTSEYEAYLFTMAKYWPGEEKIVLESDRDKPKSAQRIYLLAPPKQRPTLHQFRYAGKLASLCATLTNQAARILRRRQRALRGKSAIGAVLLGQYGMIDSTSEDQTPVSEFNRLVTLSSTWRSMVIEVKTGYILGFYSGFERPSTMTNLLAILHAGSSKVAFCARYGITITDEEWKWLILATITADGGEMKSEEGFASMSEAEISVEISRSWMPEDKGGIESKHQATHVGVDHKLAGTTGGTVRERGEPSRDEGACRTHAENVRQLIKWVLWHNNEQLVRDLVTDEMGEEVAKKPTRRAIFEWYVKNGYLAPQPMDIEALRLRCLPFLKAVIHRDGIYIRDPRNVGDEKKLIPNLVFNNKWLSESGIWRGKPYDTEVQLDPNDLGRCFLRRKGELHEITRQSHDPSVGRLCLREHIDRQDGITDAVHANEAESQNQDLNRLKELHKSNKDAKALRDKAAKDAKQQGNKPQEPVSKRESTNAERNAQSIMNLGLDTVPPVQVSPPGSGADAPCDDQDAETSGTAATAAALAEKARFDRLRSLMKST